MTEETKEETEPEATPGVPSAPAGKYRLAVGIWNELVSKPKEPREFVKHVKGDVVTLNSDDADRLLRAGAVEPLTAAAKAAAADIGPTAIDKAKETNRRRGARRMKASEDDTELS